MFCFLFSCQRKAIAAELQGHVKEATESPHANYVLQKALAAVAASLFESSFRL